MKDNKYLVSLDYDNNHIAFVVKELFDLKFRFGRVFELWVSSDRGFHIKCPEFMTLKEGFEILDYSKCSHDYKMFCKKVNCFPIRETKKEVFKNEKLINTSPKPEFILRI